MKTRNLLALSLLASLAAACGDDGNSTPDAPTDTGGSCSVTTVNEITSYPGQYSGTVVGGGRDHTATETTCTTNTGDQWYDPKGEDVVITLSNLTVGETYAVTLTTQEDLSFYVTSECPPATGTVTGCLMFTDETLGNETGTFTATAATHYLVVDNPEDELPATGNFVLDIKAAECTEATEATDCQAAAPYCVMNTCVQCITSFDCGMAAPVCAAGNTCAAGATTCTADDAREAGTSDDGPTVAHVLTAPTTGNPTTINGGVCNSPATEEDWYKVDLGTTPGNLGVTLSFTGATNDLDVYLLSAAGSVIESGESNAGITEAIQGMNIQGTVYIVVRQYMPTGNTAAVPYTLTVARPECQNDFGCTVAANPVCNGAGTCGPGPAACVGDDAADTGTPDDGPAAARTLTSGAALTGSVCSSPSTEADWYKITVTNGQGLTVNLGWTGTADLDPTVYDATGNMVGTSFWLNPEVVTLTYLPAGTYYIKVNRPEQANTAVQAYTITATATAAQTCTTSADCAATYATQVYRGNCTGGSCAFITTTGGANGSACDSSADCTGARCSYISFESDANLSVCTTACTTTADCAALGVNYKCTGFSSNNICVPGCTTDLQCGANPGSATIDANQPWNYLTCTVATGVCGP